MRILVTGSLGNLGVPLVQELRERGHDVWGCDRQHSGAATFYRADVADYRQLSWVFEMVRPQAVYHLAAEFGRLNGERFYEDLWRTAAIGTRNVLELCSMYEARLLHASSSEVYGEIDADTLSEGITTNQAIWPPNEYAISKLANEMQIASFQRRHAIEAVRLRFFNAYGREHYHAYRSVVCLFCHKALHGEVLPVFENYHRTFMFIDDFTPTLANACEANLTQPVYNIGGRDYRSVFQLANIVLDTVHGNGWAGDADERIDLIPVDEHNVRSKRPDITFARRDLGHDPKITLEEGVPETVEWMRQNKPQLVSS